MSFEIRKYIRVIVEHKILSEQYLNEAIEILKEVDEPSPTFTWDFTEDKPSPTYQWDIEQDSKKTSDKKSIFDQAKEKIDQSLFYVKTKEQAVEYLKKLFEKIKDLPKDVKLKLTKYVASALLSVIGFSALTALISNTAPEIEKEVVKSFVGNQKQKEVNLYSYPTQVSSDLIEYLKGKETLQTKAYDIKDGAYTIGWGHAIFKDPSRGSTGGDYPFIPKYKNIIPNVTEITPQQAEQLLKDDVNKAKSDLDEILKEWDAQGIHVDIDQQMYDSMVSMIYNMGIGKFRNSKFIQYVKRGDFINAAKAIDIIDDKKLLDKYPGLVTRRAEEKNIFSTNLNIPPTDISEIRKIIRNILKENIV